MARLKRKRGTIRTAATKLMDEIQQLLQRPVSSDCRGELQEKLDLLAVKEDALEQLNSSIEELTLDDAAFDDELAGSQTYQDRICITRSRATQRLNAGGNEGPSRTTAVRQGGRGNGGAGDLTESRRGTSVKLPKLEIPKFSGDLREWGSFWDQFDSTINSNPSISKVDKFKYLKSYLIEKAATAVSGLSLTAENYDVALMLLKERFNRRNLIIDEHMSRLLNLPKVGDSGQARKLRELYDEVTTEVRSLEALNVPHTSYGVLLLSALRKAIPNDLNLEYDRKHIDGDEDIKSYLEFLRIEVASRERLQHVGPSGFEGRRPPLDKQRHPNTPSGLALMVSAELPTCVFCGSNDHKLERCTKPLSIQEKKEKLKLERRRFRCGKKYHRSRECRNASRLRCVRCGGRHLTVMCDPVGIQEQVSPVASTTLASSTSSRCSGLANGTVLLQTARVWVESETRRQLVRVLLDSGNQRSFIKRSLSEKLKCQLLGEEQLTLHTFGTDLASQMKCRRVQVWLRSKYNRNEVPIEALEMPDICNDVMEGPNSDLVSGLRLNGMLVADLFPYDYNCEDDIGILIGGDFFWRVVTGETKHISESLVAVNTRFGWTFLGPSHTSPATICSNVGVMRVTVEMHDPDLSKEVKKFWELEHLGIQHI
ncbi:uncharacterized protein LOC135373322 [Ornithodoros turicata]|uniref:uncharacterized protein LOC135373322 n=1 Tax=Ornithodoros turicata TaxID=34597 RepID=UPI003139BE94